MELEDMSATTLAAAASAIGDGSVTMVNLLWFKPRTDYPAGFASTHDEPRSGYYDGYGGAFVALAQQLGVEGVEIAYRGSRSAALVAAPADDWDDIVVVRYRSFIDFRRIVESEPYDRLVRPHHVASIANFRLIATRAI